MPIESQNYYELDLKANENSNNLKITTLGNFNVFFDTSSLAEKNNNSLKLWELFKYLITFRDELILPEKIIYSLWPEADYTDPKRTLRALIFRLRKILNGLDSNDTNSIIIYSHGCYKLNTKENCVIDVVEFEDTFHKAFEVSKEEPTKAIQLFKKVIDLYKGDYLSETYGHDWLIPARNHYRRIFLQSVYEVAELLKEQEKYQEILAVCEKALKYEMYEEDLHFRYIESLAASGKIKQAKNHYKYVVEIFEREMGVKPSSALNKLYRMLFGEISKNGFDMTSIAKNLSEELFSNGPMLCDAEVFKILHQLEQKRSERYGQTSFLGMLTLSMSDYTMPPQKILQGSMEELKQVLLTTLRKGDVITEWNEAQFLLNLPGLNIEQANRALDRIQKKFILARQNTQLVVHKKVEETLPIKM